jgi:hypothetical protein
MRFGGKARPMAFSAPRTRSRLSATALSARPTMVKAGMPGLIWTWTSTARASMPSKATVVTRANMPTTPVWRGRTVAKQAARFKNNS